MTEPETREELAGLAAGLRAQVERLRARGRLRAHPAGPTAAAGPAAAGPTAAPTAGAGRPERVDRSGAVVAAAAEPSAPGGAAPRTSPAATAGPAAPTPTPTPTAARSRSEAPGQAPPGVAAASATGQSDRIERGVTTSEPQDLRTGAAAPEPTPAEAKSSGPLAAPGAEAPSTAAVARAAADLEALEQAVAGCEACGLCRTRTRTVFADGPPSARVMFVGEAPGADEDRQGVPFVGRAGQLLSDIVTKGMGLRRPDDVYIANVLKCRPPENRDPTPEEKALCTAYLERQIELVDPEVIVPLGRHAAQHLLASDAPMGRLRGRVHRVGGRAVVPTYHPAYLLRSPNMKPAAWEDIQLAMAELGLPIPGRGRSRPPRQG